jgi:thymidylate kinase
MGRFETSKLVLVEGVAGIGKSTLIDGLIRKYIDENEKIRTLLHLTQAHTYGPLAPDEDNKTLSKRQNSEHLEKIYEMLLWHVSCVRKEKIVKFFCIIDTLHITHCFRPGILLWSDVRDFDKKLADLGCKLIFYKVNKQSIWERGIWGRRNNQFITKYGKKFGKNLKEIHQYFVEEQKKMQNLVKKSKMKKIIIDGDGDIDQSVKKAYSFWIG